MLRSGSISDRLTDFVIRFRKAIIISGIILGTGFALLIPFSETDPEIRNYIPAGMKSRTETDKIEKEFGVQDMIIILFTDSCILEKNNLEMIKAADRSLARISGIINRTSPFTVRDIRNEEGSMVADRLIGELPVTVEDMEDLACSVKQNRFANGIVFSDDLTTASITAFIDNNVPETMVLRQVDSILKPLQSRIMVRTGGLPYIRKHIMEDVRKDALFLVPLALLIMVLMLKMALGSWKSVLMPFSVVLVSTVISMGLLPLAGWKMSIITLLVPVIMIAVANNYGIYLTARSQEITRSEPEIEKSELLRRLYSSLNMPIIFSGLTTIAGILGLLTHSIIPARHVGILSAAGVSVALVLSLLLIPAMISEYGIHADYDKNQSNRYFRSVMDFLTALITEHNGKILIAFITVTVLISAGMLLLRTDTNQENYFPARHPVKAASEVINSKFGGSQTISVMVSGDILDPVVMGTIDSLTRKFEEKEGVGRVFSISVAVREISKAIYDPDEEGYDKIPSGRDAIAQFFELYYMSGEPDDFRQLINPEQTRANIVLKLSDPGNSIIRRIRREISGMREATEYELTIGGYALIMDDFAREIIRGQVTSLVLALITVFMLLSIIFRSFRGGLTGSIPLGMSIIVVFGFMGITGVALDAATALLSSIMIGVGVDFTVQYLWCFRQSYNKCKDYVIATKDTLDTIGRSIIINALSVMAGFFVLVFSGFISIRFFGFLVFISIGSCLAGAILFIPSFIIRYRPRFATKDK